MSFGYSEIKFNWKLSSEYPLISIFCTPPGTELFQKVIYYLTASKVKQEGSCDICMYLNKFNRLNESTSPHIRALFFPVYKKLVFQTTGTYYEQYQPENNISKLL